MPTSTTQKAATPMVDHGDASTKTPYVVLYQERAETGAGTWHELRVNKEDLASEGGTIDGAAAPKVGQLLIVNTRGDDQARLGALAHSKLLDDLAHTEKGVRIWPVPLRSYNPAVRRYRQYEELVDDDS